MLDKMMIVIASVGLLAAPAQADKRDDAKQQVKAADIDYRLGRFASALEAYTRAYELYPVPPLLFNIGQCHRNLHDHAKAIFFFEGYLRDAPTAANRALVEDLIRESKAELERARAVEPPPKPPVAPTTPSTTVTPVATGASAASPSPAGSQRPERPAPEGGSRVVPVTLIVGGAAAVAAGAAFYYYGQKSGPEEKYVYDDTRLVGGVSLALGGAAIVTGVILWRRQPAAAPVIALAPRGGYVGWAGAF